VEFESVFPGFGLIVYYFEDVFYADEFTILTSPPARLRSLRLISHNRRMPIIINSNIRQIRMPLQQRPQRPQNRLLTRIAIRLRLIVERGYG